MSDLVEFRHLKYILALAQEGNFTKASERLFLAQPSLSKQIKDLEDFVGFPMFIRNREGVAATPAGQMVITYAAEALSARDEILAMALAVHKRDVPPLKLGFSSFIKSSLLESFRDSYAKTFPGCEIRLSGGEPANVLQRMRLGTLDGAFLPMPIEGADWVVHEVAREPLVVCMRADDELAREQEIPLATLGAKLKIFKDPDIHPSAHKRLIEMLLEVGIKPEFSCCASTPADIQWMVRVGYGVALLDQSFVTNSDLTTRPIAGVRWTADTAFVHFVEAEHLALRILARTLKRMRKNGSKKRTISPAKDLPIQLDLLA